MCLKSIKLVSPRRPYPFQAKYIGQCIEEIKEELRQENINVKCNAVAKLTYVSCIAKNYVNVRWSFCD